MHPDYPIVTGTIHISEDWQLTLKKKYNRRIEDESLVLWRPEFTLWIDIWDNNHQTTIKQRLEEWHREISTQAVDIKMLEDRFSYRLNEGDDDNGVAAFYAFIFGKSGNAQLAIYFDNEKSITEAEAIFHSFKELR